MRSTSRWTPSEDAILLDAVNEIGTKEWTRISKRLPGRKGKQCRERWRNHLDPRIINTPFTKEEDAEILRLVAQLGTAWADICMRDNLEGRSENAIKNRYYAKLKKSAEGTSRAMAESEEEEEECEEYEDDSEDENCFGARRRPGKRAKRTPSAPSQALPVLPGERKSRRLQQRGAKEEGPSPRRPEAPPSFRSVPASPLRSAVPPSPKICAAPTVITTASWPLSPWRRPEEPPLPPPPMVRSLVLEPKAAKAPSSHNEVCSPKKKQNLMMDWFENRLAVVLPHENPSSLQAPLSSGACLN